MQGRCEGLRRKWWIYFSLFWSQEQTLTKYKKLMMVLVGSDREIQTIFNSHRSSHTISTQGLKRSEKTLTCQWRKDDCRSNMCDKSAVTGCRNPIEKYMNIIAVCSSIWPQWTLMNNSWTVSNWRYKKREAILIFFKVRLLERWLSSTVTWRVTNPICDLSFT